jgi:hypothetical protein
MRVAHFHEVAKSLITKRLGKWAVSMILKVKLLERDHSSQEITFRA